MGGVREVKGHLFEILVQPRELYKKGTYVPFCQPCTGQELNIVGGLREVQSFSVVTLCGCPGHYRQKGT